MVAPAGAAHIWIDVVADPAVVEAGDEVTLTGGNIFSPTEIRLEGFDGPLLGVFDPGPEVFDEGFQTMEMQVTIPADLAPGHYELYVFEVGGDGNPENITTRIPGRTMVSVVGEGGLEALGRPDGGAVERPAALSEGGQVGALSLLLVALGVAAVGLLASAGFVASRRRSASPARAGAKREVSK